MDDGLNYIITSSVALQPTTVSYEQFYSLLNQALFPNATWKTTVSSNIFVPSQAVSACDHPNSLNSGTE